MTSDQNIPSVPLRRSETSLSTSTRDTLPWKLGTERREEGALTREQMASLRESHDVDEVHLLELSRQIASALSEKLTLAQPELSPSRDEKGVREARKLLKSLETAESKLKEAALVLENLRFRDPLGHIGRPNPAEAHLANFRKSCAQVEEFRGYISTMAEHQLTFSTGTPDKRRMRDERRRMICTAIFNAWEENGDKLSYTTETDKERNQRVGPLVDFINAVVACITDPVTELSGETIRSEIDWYRSISVEV